MGTSAGSSGPRSGISIVPAWADALPSTTPLTINPLVIPQIPASQTPVVQDQIRPLSIAQPGRFSSARRAASEFGSSGNTSSLKRSLGHHIRSGYNGHKVYTSRMSRTATYSGGIAWTLQQLNSPGGVNGLSGRDLVGKSASDVCATLLDQIIPMDGSLDADLGRDAFYVAISDYMDDHAEFNYSEIGEADIHEILKRFMAESIYQRFFIDLHNSVINAADSLAMALRRISDIRDFIREEVRANYNFDQSSIDANSISAFSKSIIVKIAKIFEDYLE